MSTATRITISCDVVRCRATADKVREYPEGWAQIERYTGLTAGATNSIDLCPHHAGRVQVVLDGLS